MADNPQARNINVSLGPAATGFLGTVWGKVVAILAAVSLIIGIVIEVQTVIIQQNNIIMTGNNAKVSGTRARPDAPIPVRAMTPAEMDARMDALDDKKKRQGLTPAEQSEADDLMSDWMHLHMGDHKPK